MAPAAAIVPLWTWQRRKMACLLILAGEFAGRMAAESFPPGQMPAGRQFCVRTVAMASGYGSCGGPDRVFSSSLEVLSAKSRVFLRWTSSRLCFFPKTPLQLPFSLCSSRNSTQPELPTSSTAPVTAATATTPVRLRGCRFPFLSPHTINGPGSSDGRHDGDAVWLRGVQCRRGASQLFFAEEAYRWTTRGCGWWRRARSAPIF